MIVLQLLKKIPPYNEGERISLEDAARAQSLIRQEFAIDVTDAHLGQDPTIKAAKK